MSTNELQTLRSRHDEPVFAAPWEATAFALRAHLVDQGALDAGRFAELLGEEVRRDHKAQDDGTAYFVAFVTALERALAEIAPEDLLRAEQDAWREAAARTPHGVPVTLDR